MQEYELTGHATARVWERTSRDSTSYLGVSIEVAVPRGPMCEYGLLGGTRLGVGGGCHISAPVDGARYDDSLVRGIDDVYESLPSEFRDYVTRTFLERSRSAQVRYGVDFDRACHGMVGSNGEVFARLAMAVMIVNESPSILRDESRLISILDAIRHGGFS